MRTLRSIISILTLCMFMSGSALMTAAQTAAPDNQVPDTQQYDQPNDNSATLPEAATPQDPMAQPQDQAQQQEDEVLPPPSNDSAQSTQEDPPARAARLQYITGSVSVQPQGTGDWVAGEINRPLTNSDNIWADKNSKAEIGVGTGVVRMGSESSLTLTNVIENTVQLQLHQGELYLHVRRLYDNERYEVDTPNQAFTVEKPGDYRFDVNPDTDKTIITVWRGEGESTGDGPTVRIHANEQVRFSNGTSMTVDTHTAPGPDDFDEWAQSRDQRQDQSASSRYVSPDTVGGDDLDEYGVWKETPDYGAVWYPSVAPGWAPYYYGHWIWEAPWGWTWVDYEPWGFAPFHYGRWVYGGGGWGWAPGPIYARPYYAPALVAWFGGGGWGVGIGFGGGFGWCPLGWGEPFIPWYGASFGYFRGVNYTNTRITNINITNIYHNNFVNGRPVPGGGINGAHNGSQFHYANMNRPGGFTAVSRNALVNSLSVAHNNIRVAPNQLSRMTPVRSLGVAPTRASIAASTGARAAVPPAHAFSRPVVSHMTAPNRGSFNRGPVNASSRPAFNNNGARPQAGTQRSAIGNANRGPAFNNSRAPQTSTRTPQPGSMGSRSVPRPPSAGNFGGR
ncbi:MAG TPA: DUF6600 domain-containing protein, partial [Candidatus Sulfotelmatobacter sp.]|nr:DUF6600 domain-containing protein [Candidatus Sulfotelmatobacter sp.]